MLNNNITYNQYYNGNQILTNAQEGLGCYYEILNRLDMVFNDMTSQYSRVFFMRADLKFPIDFHYINNNHYLERFLHNFSRHLKNKGINHKYLWVRELTKTGGIHYHLVFLMEGHKTISTFKHFQNMEHTWARVLGITSALGLVDHCTVRRDGTRQNNGLMITKDVYGNLSQEYGVAFEWASYLAKVNTKSASEGVRSFGSSSLRRGNKM